MVSFNRENSLLLRRCGCVELLTECVTSTDAGTQDAAADAISNIRRWFLLWKQEGKDKIIQKKKEQKIREKEEQANKSLREVVSPFPGATAPPIYPFTPLSPSKSASVHNNALSSPSTTSRSTDITSSPIASSSFSSPKSAFLSASPLAVIDDIDNDDVLGTSRGVADLVSAVHHTSLLTSSTPQPLTSQSMQLAYSNKHPSSALSILSSSEVTEREKDENDNSADEKGEEEMPVMTPVEAVRLLWEAQVEEKVQNKIKELKREEEERKKEQEREERRKKRRQHRYGNVEIEGLDDDDLDDEDEDEDEISEEEKLPLL